MGAPTRRERAEQVAFWRYQVIGPATDTELTARQRGRVVRALASQTHPGPFGGMVAVSRETLDRWIRAWRRGGFEALKPRPRQAATRTPVEVLELAANLKREKPERTAAQVRRIMMRMLGDAPSESTLLRHFRRLDLPQVHRQATGRFQADFAMEIWVGDALHGPRINGKKTYLFAFLDDYSRYPVAARWAHGEDTCRLAIALKPALLAWGVPNSIYVDNGAAFKDHQLGRACARLGIRLIHSRPGRPQGRGKIERFFNTVTSQFLTEIADPGAGPDAPGTEVGSLDRLNDLFRAWLEVSYQTRPNDTTGQPPGERWHQGRSRIEPRTATMDQINEAFLWSQTRTVTLTGVIKLFGNLYQSDPLWAGRRVEVVYDPFDLTSLIEVRHQDQTAGPATLIDITRHVAPKAVHAAREDPAAPSGVDYLNLLKHDHDTATAHTGLDYRALTGAPAPGPAATSPPPAQQPATGPSDPRRIPGDQPLW